MPRSAPFTIALVVATAAATLAATMSGPLALEAEVEPVHFNQRLESYPVTDHAGTADASDDRTGTTRWRVVEDTGNCCETYPHVGADGRLYDFGGTFIHFSDDRGATWSRVVPDTPLVNGEGTLVTAPNGDVLGVGWDPYSGDHLQAYKYEAETGTWLYEEMPLHTPFYDREWVAVVPGPFTTVAGEEVPYITFVRGGWPSKELYLMSTDGLSYHQVSSKFVDRTFSGESVEGPLPITADASSDWTQPNTNTGITPLGDGHALAGPDYPGLTAEFSLLDPETRTWSAYTLPGGSDPVGRFQIDSRGWIHNVIADTISGEPGFTYRISDDGGSTFTSLRVPMPDGEVIEEVDFKANGAVGIAAVLVRAQADSGGDRDLLFKLDVSGPEPVLSRSHEVGLGDAGATSGVGNDVRYDFASVGMFPDGRVAVSFLDSTTGGRPGMAIEQDTSL